MENEKPYDPKVHLSYSDIAANSSVYLNVISLSIKQSEMDQFRKGVKVVIGQTNNNLCPVSTLLSYLSCRGNFWGPLFCWHKKTPRSKHKKTPRSKHKKTPRSKMKFVSHVRLGLSRANFPADKYDGHSFQIGAATTAALAGIEDSTIQTLG